MIREIMLSCSLRERFEAHQTVCTWNINEHSFSATQVSGIALLTIDRLIYHIYSTVMEDVGHGPLTMAKTDRKGTTIVL